MEKRLTTAGAAQKAGIARHTLQRWIRIGRVRAPKPVVREGRAVRLWSPADVDRLRKVKTATYRRGRGRKKKTKP
jgi:predicted site-specific integrase-resolvase